MDAAIKNQDGEILLGALFVMLTNWESAEARDGRRGRYLTTGAMNFRLKTVPNDIKGNLVSVLNGIGLDASEDDIDSMFAGLYEYQVGFSLNRFESKSGQGINLTQREKRAMALVAELVAQKPEAVKTAFPQLLKKAG